MTRPLFRAILTVAGVAMLWASQAEARNLKVGHFGSPSTPFNDGIEFFVKKIEDVSGGEITATNFPSGQLGNEAQQIGALQGGLQEILITSSTNLIKYNPRFQLIDIPFAFADDAATDRVLLGSVGQTMLDGLAGSNMVGLTFIDNGFRDLTNSKHPITKLGDFKGLSFRVIGAPVFIDTFKALGANPVPMPFPEVYTALETHTVDGQDNPLLTARDQNFYEVQKYLTHSKHAYSALVFLISEPFWKSLNDKERQQIKEAADAAALENRKFMRAAVEQARTFLATEGKMDVVEFAPEALVDIHAAVEPVVKGMVTDALRPLYEEMQAAAKAN
ncbi:TRAP transporter substrate-binding protein [Allorhizobium borbori]|uniref:Tripartite ATP-independent transporter DctP family solute receptor n=1 Tax=Allorhizobium borbori TaxID=485907 RepID=A0A7W6K4S8_9HYPH|nr:DctP family TRAP transporter solute-binding subunit [Allorhizobium borbori]MBB4105228.1 tripartite ATP-independent transporter DctP family solute receptor [Allorhizobium borbori]